MEEEKESGGRSEGRVWEKDESVGGKDRWNV